ncbi:MAG: hypothetical protein AB8B63_16265 [Granulosicoccus sp.]
MTIPNARPEHEGNDRNNLAHQRRLDAADIARGYNRRATLVNGDENTLQNDGFAMSFTKGLHHNDNGLLIENAHYQTFVEAINQALALNFDGVQRGITAQRQPKTRFSGEAENRANQAPEWRGWESPRAGHYYSLEGPDADAMCMPPAPELGSVELSGETAEVYALALLRDMTFAQIAANGVDKTPSELRVEDIIQALLNTSWYSTSSVAGLSLQERRRRAARAQSHDEHDIDNPPQNLNFPAEALFRGSAPGVRPGPYISQFMLQGNRMVRDDNDENLFTGASIVYGSQEIDQKAAFFPEAIDYMLHWNAYLDVQNGANFTKSNRTSPQPRRFIDTPRDLATYVRFDQLYQAYLNASLIMLGFGDEFKLQQPIVNGSGEGPGFPDRTINDSRQGFATFGGPHVLSLMTEVATRCLKAVRRQKFNYHRRARPERIGALLTLDAGALPEVIGDVSLTGLTRDTLSDMRTALGDMLPLVNKHNKSRRLDNSTVRDDRPARADRQPHTTRPHADPHLLPGALDPAGWDDDFNYLMPMAFAEGSPLPPSYGAGHATVAGGCVTILKAFFHTVEDDGSPVLWPEDLPIVQVEPGSDAQQLRDIRSSDASLATDPVTIEGELNKLAANISIGRNMAGVHFYTDYYESLRMGERVSTGILLEHLSQMDEPIEMDFHSFDGDHVHLLKSDASSNVEVFITKPDGGDVNFADWWVRHCPNVPA